MKNAFENWREYLKEEEVVTFDFDSTLSLSHWGKEEDNWVHDGPYLPMIKMFKQYKNKGYKVYIVTSRYSKFEKDAEMVENQRSVKEFVEEYHLYPDGIIFTDGNLKADTLKSLNSLIHYDDDPVEIQAAEEIGIKTVLVDPYKENMHQVDENKAPRDINKISKVIIYNKNGQILILKRTNGEQNWDLPGGHLQKEEDFIAAAKRETKEETNLTISDIKPMETYRNINIYKTACPNEDIRLQPKEHVDFKWVNPKDVHQYNMRKYLKLAVLKAFDAMKEDFQHDVKKNYTKLKFKLLGGGGNKYNVGGKMKKPSYKRSKSAPTGFGGS